MRKAAALLLALCLALAAACAPGTVAGTVAGTTAPASDPPAVMAAAPTPAPEPRGLLVTAADAGQNPVPNASVTLTDRITLKTSVFPAGEDGIVSLETVAPGKYFLTVSAPGYMDAKRDADFSGEFLSVAVTLKRGAAVKRFLMTITAVSASDRKSRVYLAQSEDGIAWEPFPGFAPFEDTGGAAVALRDGLILLYTQAAIRRYDVSAGAWDAARPYTVHTDDYFNGRGAVNYTPLTREPGLFPGKDGRLMFVGAQIRDQQHSYTDDGFTVKNGEAVNLVGLAEEYAGSGGLILRYPRERYLYKEKFKAGQFAGKDVSDPFVLAAPGMYYLLFTKTAGIAALQSEDMTKGYKAVPGLADGLLYAGANSGATGWYDAGPGRAVLLIATNAGGKPALSRYEAGSLAAAVTQKTGDIDLAFLGEAPSSIACPCVWDTAASPQKPEAPQARPIGFASGWYPGNAFTREECGGTQTGTSGSDDACTLSFSKNTCWIYGYQDAVFHSFTCALEVKPGAGAVAEGLVYCWNPVDTNIGGYVFAVDGEKWSLMLFRPTRGSAGMAVSPVKSMDVLASGGCPASAGGCTLTVRYGMGLHELYIDGVKVGEYRDTGADPGFAAGYVGVYAASGENNAKIGFTALRMLEE